MGTNVGTGWPIVALIADVSLSASLLLIGAICVDRLSRRRSSADLRHRLWASTFIGLLALPIFSSILPEYGLAVLPLNWATNAAYTQAHEHPNTAVESPEVLQAPLSYEESLSPFIAKSGSVRDPLQDSKVGISNQPGLSIPVAAPISRSAASDLGSIPNEQNYRLALVLAVFYVLGFAFVIMPMARGLIQNHRLGRRSTEIGDTELVDLMLMLKHRLGIARSVLLRESDHSHIPMTWGMLQPTILFPHCWRQWDSETRRLVMLHELAHVKRLDVVYQSLARVAVAIYWFHPLVWVALWRIRIEREQACDDCVLMTGETPSNYAQQLLMIASSFRARALPPAVAMAHSGGLEQRIKALLDQARSRVPLSPRSAFSLTLGSLVLALVLAALRLESVSVAATEEKIEDPRELPVFQSTEKLEGQVIGLDGRPIGGADVFLLPNPDGAFILPVKPQLARTADDGTFVFDHLMKGGYQIWSETGMATSLVNKLRGRRVKIVEGSASNDKPPATVGPETEQTDALQLILHQGCGFDVNVRDMDGNAIAGADISFAWTDIDRHYASDSDGVARIRNLAMDEWFVVVRAPRMATDWFKTSKQNLGSILPLDFQLKPGGSVRIKVVDETGASIPDAMVSVNATTVSMSPNYARAATDTDGELVADGLPLDGVLQVYASKDGFESANREITVPNSDRMLDLNLVLNRKPYGGDVRVHVTDEQGNPIEGAEIANRGKSSADMRRATTDAQGIALLQDVQSSYAGTVVIAKAAGFIAQEAQASPGTIEAPGELKFQLQPGKTLRGRIVNPAGQPMPNLRVYYDRGENGDLKGGRVDTDSDGRFELTGLRSEVLFTVYTPPEFAPIRQLVLRTDLDEVMELTLVPTGLLLVRAVDANTDQPIPAFNVRIGFCEDSQPGDRSPTGISTSLIEDGVNILGDVKEYRLDNQVAGTAFKVIVSAAGYETVTIARMVTENADVARCVDVPMQKEDMQDYQSVAGRILDADGRPVAGAAVRLL
ncbi:MAG: carboxypeptidase regulatory-like domain-containing protein, partial [Planctomycetales bacterium]|nr:carboxypeptidase regulatory-like domain-containing protein [Planctomycetales bacterium]